MHRFRSLNLGEPTSEYTWWVTWKKNPTQLPDFPLTAGAKAALIHRTAQVRILEVISGLRTFMDPLRVGEVDIDYLFRESGPSI